MACAVIMLLCAQPVAAFGIASSPRHAVNPTPAGAGRYATYVIGPCDVDNGETITRVAVTFPAECDVSGAQAIDAGDTVSVSGQTVTLTFGTAKTAGSQFSYRIANVRNPMTDGSYSLVSTVFTASNGATTSVSLQGKRGVLKILASPYLVLTIETPDDVQTVDFGTVDPGVAAPSKTVLVTVDSSLAYTVSRTLSGDVAAMGLTVSTLPAAVQPAGVATYSSVYGITPPWSTVPGVPLHAAVVYTVTQ